MNGEHLIDIYNFNELPRKIYGLELSVLESLF